jgi:glycopeptide antibiotics resistance protein
MKYKKNSIQNFIRKTFAVFINSFYFSLVFQITIISRIIEKRNEDPLSDVFGGWLIKQNNYVFDFSAVLNILLFLPLCACVMFVVSSFAKKHDNSKLVVAKIGVFSFLMSLLIELIQLIFHLGTFQISDLVYNTLGGILGAFIYIIIYNKKHRG